MQALKHQGVVHLLRDPHKGPVLWHGITEERHALNLDGQWSLHFTEALDGFIYNAVDDSKMWVRGMLQKFEAGIMLSEEGPDRLYVVCQETDQSFWLDELRKQHSIVVFKHQFEYQGKEEELHMLCYDFKHNRAGAYKFWQVREIQAPNNE
eukprot:202241-Lingulodinium_polyedra.AAC.1